MFLLFLRNGYIFFSFVFVKTNIIFDLSLFGIFFFFFNFINFRHPLYILVPGERLPAGMDTSQMHL